MTFQKRYLWVDYAKFLSMFSVVYFHTSPVLPGMWGASLHFFMMPCFFFLAGFLFRFDKYPTFKQYVIHRSRQLLIPYFCFFILFYTYWLIIGKETGASDDLAAPFYQPILEYLCGTPRLICIPLWFVPCLFVMQCLFYLIFKQLKRFFAVSLLFSFPFIALIVDLDNTPFSLDSLCAQIPFYGMAVLYKKEIFDFLARSKIQLFLGLISLMIHVVFCFFFINPTSNLQHILIELIGGFSILLPVLIFVNWLSGYLGKNDWITKMASNAIIILAFHTYSIIFIQRLILWVSDESLVFFEGKYTLKLIIAVVAMASMIVPIWFINEYTPFVLDKQRV